MPPIQLVGSGRWGLGYWDMTSWSGLFGNALWICGLAVCLAAVSMAHYRARAGADRLRDRLREPRSRLAIAVGLILFCAGILLTSDTVWEKGIWGVGAALLTLGVVRLWIHRGADRGKGT